MQAPQTHPFYIYFKGLSLIAEKSDPTNPHWDSIEVAYLEKEHEPISLELTDGHRKCWTFPKPRQPFRKIHVTIAKLAHSRPSTFKTGNPADPTDFSRMPDLEKWHAPATTELKPTSRLHMSAKISVRDALFFTAENSETDAVVTNLDTDEYRVFSEVGTVLGASIPFSAGESVIVSVNAIEQISGTLKVIDEYTISDPSKPHCLEINYVRENCSHDPLHLLYDHFVKTSDGSRFRFEYIGKAIPSDQYACQPYGGGGSPLPDFP